MNFDPAIPIVDLSQAEPAFVPHPLKRIKRRKILRILEQTFPAKAIVALMPRRLIEFRILSERDVKGLRDGYNRQLRADFKEAAYEEFTRVSSGMPRKDFNEVVRDFNIHHKFPTILGGDNGFNRLVLIEKRVHEEIHKDIHHTITDVQEVQKDHRRSARSKYYSLEHDLAKLPNVYLGAKNEIFISIPWPEGRVCIPQLLAYEHGLNPRHFRPNAPSLHC